MNIDKIKVGDIVEFKITNDVYYGLVTSKGYKFVKEFHNPNNVLYVKILEYPVGVTLDPEGEDFIVMADKVIKVFIIAEKVSFS